MNPDDLIKLLLDNGTLRANPDTGEIFKRHGNKYRKVGYVAHNGYVSVTVRHEGYRTHLLAHRIVWISVNGMPAPELVVCHLDNDKTHNGIRNLMLDTRSENVRMAWRDGLGPVAERNHMTKVLPNEAAELVLEYMAGTTQEKLAMKHGITRGHVGWILDRHLGYADRRRKFDSQTAEKAAAEYRQGKGTLREVGRRYGISQTHMRRLVTNAE